MYQILSNIYVEDVVKKCERYLSVGLDLKLVFQCKVKYACKLTESLSLSSSLHGKYNEKKEKKKWGYIYLVF